MKANEIYNLLVNEIPKIKSGYPKASNFGLKYEEFEAIINKIENDGLFKRGKWALTGEYIFKGLTFDGMSFLENNDKKEYHKIEKIEINYNNTIHIGRDNNAPVITGNNNIVNSEFEQKYDNLINDIYKLDIVDKEQIIQELNSKKNNKVELNKYLGTLLTRGSEVASITSTIVSLLGVK